MIKKIGIIGGGASGLVTAIVAARRGLDVTILEQQDELGKKILATGNGRCNLTNHRMDPACYYSESHDKVTRMLEVYSVEDVLHFFRSIGVLTKDRDGYVYPITDQASTVRDALIYELNALSVKIKLNTNITGIQFTNDQYIIKTNQKKLVFDKVVLSTGGDSGLHNSIMSTGFSLLKDLRHNSLLLSPALISFQGIGQFYKKIAGIRTNGKVTAVIDGQQLKSDIGEIQFTKLGISGIPVFQISRILTQGLLRKKQCSILVDFYPELTQDELFTYFTSRREQLIKRTVKEFLNGIWKDKLIDLFLYTARIPEDKMSSDVSNEEFKKLIRISKSFEIKLKDSDGFLKSQVTAGGVNLNEVTDKLESIFHPNLYFTGEILDVDGICGGYNLHFAWISAMIVGEAL